VSEQERPPRQKRERLVVVPARELANALEDFAAPLLEPLGARPDLDEVRAALEIGGARLGRFVLTDLRIGRQTAVDDVLELTFRRPAKLA
jgi:hypothetical protein